MIKFWTGIMIGMIYASCLVLGILLIRPLLLVPIVITVVEMFIFMDYLLDNWDN
jgi:hypothetical protein